MQDCQLYLSNELKPDLLPESNDSVIIFHIPATLKDDLVKIIKKQNLTITGILISLIRSYINMHGYLYKLKHIFKPKTGRGNVKIDQHDLVKEFMRKEYPKPVRPIQIAEYITKKTGEKITQARATRLLDNLSGLSDDKDKDGNKMPEGFLVGSNDDDKPITYFIFLDKELGIEPY